MLPLNASWTPDLWGKVRNTVKANAINAQGNVADIATWTLREQALLAEDYFRLRGQDALKKIFDDTVAAYGKSLELVKALRDTGIGSEKAVVQAETQLATTEAQATNIGIARAQYEHALAVLIGRPPSSFSLPVMPLDSNPPEVPMTVPSRLLERRSDVVAAECDMQAANAQIGVGMAAYFPDLSLTAAAGASSTGIADLFNVPNLFWSVGANLAQTIFDGGRRAANVARYRAAYLQTVAHYRLFVLTAFQEVEDALSGIRLLAEELKQQNVAVRMSEQYVQIATDRYRLGLDPYLDVIVAEVTLLSNQQAQVDLRVRALTTDVLLIQALGGGWDVSDLPPYQDLGRKQVKK
jgi:NodT family efflux transporter outer membrane factor (OMF) lipoprotein